MSSGSKIKLLRELQGMSRKEVAERSGINLRSLQDYEQGHKEIASAKADTLYRLSLTLGCSMEELLTECDVEVEAPILEKKVRRLYAYYLGIEAQDIYSSEYKAHGKWKLDENGYHLVFCYAGEQVDLPFSGIFSEKTFPWLQDAAEMMMNSYIRKMNMDRYEIEGGENWDE